jgi:hypothetical protein
MNSKLYSEILQDFAKENTKNGRIEILRKNDSPRFRTFLYYACNKDIKFDVKIPEYRPAKEPAGLNLLYLQGEMSKMYRFIVDHPKRPAGLTPEKQSSLLLQVLESLHADEAEYLVRMLKKDLAVPYLTFKLIKEAYPNINISE